MRYLRHDPGPSRTGGHPGCLERGRYCLLQVPRANVARPGLIARSQPWPRANLARGSRVYISRVLAAARPRSQRRLLRRPSGVCGPSSGRLGGALQPKRAYRPRRSLVLFRVLRGRQWLGLTRLLLPKALWPYCSLRLPPGDLSRALRGAMFAAPACLALAALQLSGPSGPLRNIALLYAGVQGRQSKNPLFAGISRVLWTVFGRFVVIRL